MSESSSILNVVVIGGGCAGIIIASKLEASLPRNYRVVLIEKRSFFYHTIGALRACSVEDVNIMLPYDKLFKKTGLFVQAQVVSITDQNVKIEPAHAQFGEVIPFSYLVIATGSTWSAPFLNVSNDLNETKEILATSRELVRNANNILVVGGGPCGIELAAEIKEVHPDKKVSLIHAQNNMYNDKFPIKFRNSTRKALEQLGVELILEDKIEFIPEASTVINARTYQTQKGKEIQADLVMYTLGGQANTAVMNTFDASLITPAGIKVRNTFQIEHPSINNIFVAGDAAGFSDSKTAYKAVHTHAPIVVSNILTSIKGKGKMKLYEPPAIENTLVVTVGKKGGTSLLGGMVFGDFTTRMIKSKGLFISSRMKDLGY